MTKKASKKTGTRKRGRKPYPVMSFENALPLATGIMTHASGHPIKRLTLSEKMKLAPNATGTRLLITTSSKYGLTQGNHNSEELKLTEEGKFAVGPGTSEARQRLARFRLAIQSTEEFNKLYERFAGSNLPAPEVMADVLEHLDEGDRSACVNIFVENAAFVGVLATKDGAEHLFHFDEVADTPDGPTDNPDDGLADEAPEDSDLSNVCFVVCPIGAEGSEERRHSDMMLNAFIERAVPKGMSVVRADKISKPGMISSQIIDYILNSALVVADLSYHNPNVFYELALRHVTGKPTVHLMRNSDKIPFDIGNFRTIVLDLEDRYSLVSKIDTYRAEISNQITSVLEAGESSDNPILTFCPGAEFKYEKG